MNFRKLLFTICVLGFASMAHLAMAQKEAAKPADGNPPAPDRGASTEAAADKNAETKTATAEKSRERRTARTVEKPADKSAPTIRLLELSGQYVDLVQPWGWIRPLCCWVVIH